MVTYVEGRNHLASDLYDHVESDCDGDLLEVNRVSNIEGGEETRAVLTIGSFSACVHFFSRPFLERSDEFDQLEVFVLLSLHRQDPVRSPKIPRCHPSLELPPRKDHYNGTSSLLAKEHIRSGQPGEVIFDREFRARD